jgi:hypothetical protein
LCTDPARAKLERMRVRWVSAGLVVALSQACISPVEPGAEANPVPFLERVEPTLFVAGTADRSVTVAGYAFVEGARVLWNGEERATTFVSPNALSAALEAGDVADVGTAAVTVENPEPGGGLSVVRDVAVGHPPPAVDSVLPGASLATLDQGITVEIYGSAFAPGPSGATALWQGTIPLATRVEHAGKLVAEVPDYLLRRGSIVPIAVENPRPGGGISNAVMFTVDNPVPLITGLTPDSVTLEQAATVVISGSGFVPGVEIWYGGTRLDPASVSATALSVSIPGSLNQRVSVPLYVVNPEPAGGASSTVEVPVRELTPYVFGLSRQAAVAGSGPLTVEVSGFDFAPDAVVTWNGDVRTTRVLAPGLVEVDLQASDFADVGMRDVRVVNPRGGGASEPLPFAVVPVGRILYESPFDTLRISNLDGSDVVAVPSVNPWLIDAPTAGSATVFEELTCEGTCLRRLRFGSPGPPYASVVQSDPLRFYEYFPSFTADGQWVYFLTSICLTTCGFSNPSDIRYGGLWRVGPDGTGEELVSLEVMVSQAPSSGGQEVAFTRDGTLHVLDVATSAVRSLGVGAADPEWSPDDQWIAYRDAQEDVRAIRPDGSDDRLLASSFDAVGRLSWSPDGRYVLVVSDQNPEPGSINFGDPVVIDVQTGELIRLLGLPFAHPVVWYGGP